MSMEHGDSTIRAVVRDLEGDFALVEVEQGGCGRCHEKGGCGGQQLTQMFCSGPKAWRVANTIGARPGERVLIAISEGSVRRVANLAYGLPLLAAIAAAAAGSSLAGDTGAIAGAALGLVAAFAYLHWRTRRPAIDDPLGQPHIVSRA